MTPHSRRGRLALSIVLALLAQSAVFSFVLLNARHGGSGPRASITLHSLPALPAESMEVAAAEDPAPTPPEETLDPTTAPVVPTPEPSAPELEVAEQLEVAAETAPPDVEHEVAESTDVARTSNMPAPSVYSAEGLDGPPSVVRRVKPIYPETARRRRLEGETLLQVLVEADGRVAELSVLKSLGDEAMDRAAIEAVRQWRFTPPLVNGDPVSVWIVITVDFNLK